MDEAGIIELIEQEVKSLSTYLDPEDYINALNDAFRETGWSCPASVSFQIHWLKMRAKRHIFFYLATESARKFKAKQFSLHQKFEHYMVIIEFMDKEFEKAKEEFPNQFTDANLEELLGSKIDAGFAYDKFGNEITYDVNQEVIITPSD
jgi:beta-galactosidase GanA